MEAVGREARRGRRARRQAVHAGLVLLALAQHPPARAQTVDCEALKGRIAAASDSAGEAEHSADELRRQQRELERAQSYYQSIGCGSGFLFSDGPPECDGIAARIERLRASLDRLAEQGQGDGGERRRALVEQYNLYCSTNPGEAELSPDDQPPTAVPGPDGSIIAPSPADTDHGPVKALCVRHCDGGYFPMSDAVPSSPSTLKALGDLCQAQCPGTEASLYTMAPGAALDSAVASDGSNYTALPAAFKFQKSYDPSCACKPPNQSWTEALANAEKLIAADKGDVVVTQKMSDDMARPAAAPMPRAGARKAARKPAPVPAAGGIAAPRPPDAGIAGDDITRQFRRAAPAL